MSWGESSRLATATPTSVQPCSSISGIAAASSPRTAFEDRLGVEGRVRQRVRPGRAGEVVEAQAQDDRAARPAGLAHATGDAVDQPDERRVQLLEPSVAGRRTARRSSRGGGRPSRGADRGCARARRGAGPRPGRGAARARPPRAMQPGRRSRFRRARSFREVTGPTPHSRSTGRGWRKASSARGGTTSRPSGFATPLATLARNFVRATPTVIGSPTRSSTFRFNREAISLGVPAIRSIPRTSRNASSIDSPSTSGVVSSKTR